MMSGIRSADTAPELKLRRGLHRAGFRYRLNNRSLPGSPDLVFHKHRAVIQVNGCLWHGHDCHLFRQPRTNPEFWRAKIDANRERDRRNRVLLKDLGWRLLEVWECAMKGKESLAQDDLVERVADWIESTDDYAEIRGATRRK
jgi:DNA mismatch endonuclease (patch repair protein)